jgi:hypothetical protein
MTAVSALLLALITGWMVPAARLAMAAFLGPWLVALIYQTADIGLGYAVSPPQTVTQFPRVIGYVVVNAVILALGLILSALIGERRSRVVPDAGRQTSISANAARVSSGSAGRSGEAVASWPFWPQRRSGEIEPEQRAVVIQARAGQLRSLTQPESMAATFADIMTAAGQADEEITRSRRCSAPTALRLTHCSSSPITWLTRSD